MDTTVIVAIVSGLCVAVPSLIATIMTNRNSNSLILYRIQELETKVEKHNHLVERTALIESNQSTMWKRIDEIRTDIEELKDKT